MLSYDSSERYCTHVEAVVRDSHLGQQSCSCEESCSTNIENSSSKSVISFRTFAFIRVMEGFVDSPLVRLSGPEQSPGLKRGEGGKHRERTLYYCGRRPA
ncbi:hypothetical protein TNCV_1354231 [Trichonephila clavipes]|nr:hypothetical protein TNCV_1354231 [Trichonephila clavipes]